ncbi:MAG: hypothetical protein U0903_06115 [Planctomycetales bacterium]
MFPRLAVRSLILLMLWGGVVSGGLEFRAQADDWGEARRAGAFVFRADFPLRDEEQLLREMSQLGADLKQTLGIKLSPHNTEVLLFHNRAAYQKYLSIRVPEGVNRPALFVKTDELARVYAFRGPELSTHLRHEGTHALLHGSLKILPLWLDEGLAEYFEVPAEARPSENPHLRSIKWGARLTWRPHLRNLAAKREMQEMGPKDYRDAWGVVHFLIHGPEPARQILVEYLQTIQKGEAPEPLEKQLEASLPGYEDRIAQHFRQWK